MLLAEELALVAARPGKGRHALGAREHLNGCLAGLLLAELVLDGSARVDEAGHGLAITGPAVRSTVLAAAAHVVDVRGPGIKAVLSAMDRGLRHELGVGTWDAVAPGPALEGRDEVLSRLQAAARGDGPIDLGTAAVLFMLRPANVLGTVAAGDRAQRRHARRRADGGLDGTPLLAIGRTVRQILADADAAVAVAASVAATC